MRIWIDLANSPHPLLFEPVARRLESLGNEVFITARDNAQTVELARERWADVTVIGGPSPRGRARKIATMGARIGGLASWARRMAVDAAVSHNSYGQIAAARWVGIPAVTAMDFEHQPANHIAFRLAKAVLLPAALKGNVHMQRQGARKKARFYDGLKEEIYLGNFVPDRSLRDSIGVKPDRPLVVARTPPSRAAYHRIENRLFYDVLRAIDADGCTCVVLARYPDQRADIEQLGLRHAIIPRQAVDSRSLLYTADLVVGAGGTMTREAALLGVPTVSVFRGDRSSADAWLAQRGSLAFLEDARSLVPIRRRTHPPKSLAELDERASALVDQFVRLIDEAVNLTGGRGVH